MYALIAFLSTLLPRKNEKGQDMAEYALLLALIAIVVIAAIVTLGPQIAAVFAAIEAALTAAL